MCMHNYGRSTVPCMHAVHCIIHPKGAVEEESERANIMVVIFARGHCDERRVGWGSL